MDKVGKCEFRGICKTSEPAPPGRVEAMWERLGSAGSGESTGRLMLGSGVAAVLRMLVNHDEEEEEDQNYLEIMEMTEMVILARREERATLVSLEAPYYH